MVLLSGMFGIVLLVLLLYCGVDVWGALCSAKVWALCSAKVWVVVPVDVSAKFKMFDTAKLWILFLFAETGLLTAAWTTCGCSLARVVFVEA